MEWSNFNLQPWINTALEKTKIFSPTAIQELVIPKALNNNNLIVSSPTGSGKTYAFLLPILNSIDTNLEKVQAIIICPTRELVHQITTVTRKIINGQAITLRSYTGGTELNKNKKIQQPQIVIGTVTRIKKLYEANILNITTAKTVVIDECDMIFELNHQDNLDFILSKMPSITQKMVFSATINNSLEHFLKKYITNTQVINLSEKIHQPKINHFFVNSLNDNRHNDLLKLLTMINPFICLIFVNHYQEITKLHELLLEHGYQHAILHGKLSARARKQTLKKIHDLKYQYVLCTDVAARGIDITSVSHVISLALPNDLKYYVHRAGRTSRNQESGNSYLFYQSISQEDQNALKKLNVFPNYCKIKNKELVPIKSFTSTIKKTTSAKAKEVINKYQNQNVKPGYKKKLKKTLAKINKNELRQQNKNKRNKKKYEWKKN